MSHPPRSAQTLLLALLLLVSSMPASAQEPGEYQRKSALICTFLRSVSWPARRFQEPGSPIVIGIYGTDSISDFLREAIQDRRYQDRPVVIKRFTRREELAGCHLLFVSRSERDKLGPILGEVRRESVLTVGESDNFLKAGGVINFVEVAGVMRYQIHGEAAKRERLTISGKLLQYALPTDYNPTSPHFTAAR